MIALLSSACSSLSEGAEGREGNPHFEYSEAFYYHWAPGTPGPVGTNYIFKFIPEKGISPKFSRVIIKGEEEKPDVSTKEDTLILMVQKSGKRREAFKGKGAEEEREEEKPDKAADSAIVRYSVEGKLHEFQVGRIPKKKRTTRFE